MFIDENFEFQVSVSAESFVDKTICNAMIGSTKKNQRNREIRKEYGFKPNRGIGYLEGTYTPKGLLDKLTEGHVFCNMFSPLKRRRDGTFGSTEKSHINFTGSYVIGVDIDGTRYKTAEDFIEQINFKPTFYYTSYSNQQDDKGARFRMIYVFDQPIRDPYHFRYFSWKLHQKIESDTNEMIKDKCGLSCSQYFNGTNKNNKDLVVSYGITNNIYEFKDFVPTKGDFLSFLNEKCYYKRSLKDYEKMDIEFLKKTISSIPTNTYYDEWQKNEHFTSDSAVRRGDHKTETDKNVMCSDGLVSDMSRLDYDEFMKYNRHKFCYFYRVERNDWVMVNDMVKYQEIDDDYFSLYYHSTRICDGHKRRKKLYQRMCLRRIIRPSVDADTLLFNAYEDLQRFCDNDSRTADNVITIDELVKNVKSAMNKTIDEIQKELSEYIGFLKSKRPKGGRIYKFKGVCSTGARNSLMKDVRWSMFAENYDCSLSVKENILAFKDIGIEVSERTLYRFCKVYGISTKGNKSSDMMEHYDYRLSLRKNLLKLKDMGYKISLGKLRKLVEEAGNTSP